MTIPLKRLFYTVSFLYLFSVFALIGNDYNVMNNIICFLISIFSSLFVILSNRKTWLKPVTIFVLSLLIVNNQLYIDLLFGLTSVRNSVFVNPNTINKGIILSAMAMAFFSCSYCNTKTNNLRKFSTVKVADGTSIIFSIVQLITFIYWFSSLTVSDLSGESFLSSGAADSDIRAYRDILFNTSQVVSVAFYLYRTNEIKSFSSFFKSFPKIVIFTSILYATIKLMTGDRGGAIWTFFLYLFSYYFIRKQSPKFVTILPLLAIGALIMTSISFGRMQGSSLSFGEKIVYVIENKDAFKGRYEDPTISPFTRELSNSVICTHIGLDQIYNHDADYHYGMFHLSPAISIIPFLGNRLLNNVFKIPRIERSSSEYVTVIYNGADYQSGLGTNTIIDNFLEFGLLSLVFAFGFLGWLFRKIDNYYINYKGRDLPLWIILMIISLACYSISIPRGQFLFYVKYYVYSVIYIYIAIKLFKSFSIRPH